MPDTPQDEAIALARELIEWASHPHIAEHDDDELTAQMRAVRINTEKVCRALLALSEKGQNAAPPPCDHPLKFRQRGAQNDWCGKCGFFPIPHDSAVAAPGDKKSVTLTSAQIERWRAFLLNEVGCAFGHASPVGANALCDMALSALSAKTPTGFEAAAKKLEERAAIVEQLERNLMPPKALYYSVEVNTLKAAAAMLRSIDRSGERNG